MLTVELEAEATVADLKLAIEDKEGIPVVQQHIVNHSELLDDAIVLKTHRCVTGSEAGGCFRVVLRLRENTEEVEGSTIKSASKLG